MQSPSCPFCDITDTLLENHLAFALHDIYPVTEGHLLILPRRHYADFFDSTTEELDAIRDLLWQGKQTLDRLFHPDGYNIGINCGLVSGQTVPHLHVHLIPRYRGDVDDPTGGVRGVIPAKQRYPVKHFDF